MNEENEGSPILTEQSFDNMGNTSPIPFEEAFEEFQSLEDELDQPLKLLFTDLGQRVKNVEEYISNISDLRLKEKAVRTLTILGLAIGSVGCTERNSNTKQDPETDTRTPITQTIDLTPTPTSTQTEVPTTTPTSIPTETSTPEPSPTPTRIPESDNPEVRGYEITNRLYDEKTGDTISTLEVLNSKIESIEVTDDGVKLDFLMDFYNIQKRVSIETDEFTYLEVDPKTYDTIMLITVDKNVNANRLISLHGEYRVVLTVEGVPKFGSSLIEQFLNDEVDLEFGIYIMIKGL